MTYAGSVLSHGIRRTLLAQGVLVLVVGVAYLFLRGGFHAASAVYGGGVALLITGLLGWRVQRASDLGARDSARGTALLYWGAVERMVVLLVALGVGMGVLKLDPLAMVIAFAVAQVGYLFRIPTRLPNDN
jgi:ATP synthase protein I